MYANVGAHTSFSVSLHDKLRSQEHQKETFLIKANKNKKKYVKTHKSCPTDNIFSWPSVEAINKLR